MKKPSSRPVHAAMLTMLLLACHRFQLSDCAKPSLSSSSSPTEKAAVFPSARRHDDAAADDDDDAHLPGMEPMTGDVVERTNDDAAAHAAPTTPVQQQGKDKEVEGVGPGPWQQQRTGALRRATLLLRPRLPRRFLAVEAGVAGESGTDGAGPSCQSHDVHKNCPPPSKR